MLQDIAARPVRGRRAPRRPRREGGRRASRRSLSARPRSPGSSSGSIGSRRTCRRSGGSSSPAEPPAGAALHLARTVCRRAERRIIALGPGDVEGDLPRVRQPSLGLSVRRGTGREPPRGRARTRMVTDLSEAYATCARFARDHYENFPVASWLLPRRDAAARGRRVRLRAHRRRLRGRRRAAGRGAPGAARRLAGLPPRVRPSGRRRAPGLRRRCGVGRHRRSVRSPRAATRHRPHLRRPRRDNSNLPPSGVAVRRPAERIPPGRDHDALRDVGRRARLLPAVGQPGRPARAGDRGLSGRRRSTAVGRAVHGAPAHELLAGSGARLAEGPAVSAARGLPARGRGHERPRCAAG